VLVAILAEMAITLLIVYSDLGNALFGTAPLPLELWLLPVPFAFGMLMLEEARKRLIRHVAQPPCG
jgi:sodium/potassium-transporting ATPase subunit alpha